MNIEEVKNKLLKEREEIKFLIEVQEKEVSEILEEPVADSDEVADRYELKEEVHLKKEILEERLAKIEKALLKIEKGNYGICDQCGNKIEDVRLEIDLASDLCRQCAIKLNK